MSHTVNVNGLLKVPNNKYSDANIVYAFKDRSIDLDKDVKVYRNLRKKKYSLKQNGIVVAHAERLCLRDCKFVVNNKLRENVIKTGQKNVHAYVVGRYTTSGMGTDASRNDLPAVVKYNPYKNNKFITDNLTINTKELKGCGFIILDEREVRASYIY